MSMGDYFKLLGVDCNKNLRDKIDVALHPLDHPTKDKYANITRDYKGDCKLRMPDGRCYIHAELGEHFLPDVCRMYPRAVRKSDVWECSCANSCEAVIEHFLQNPESITFNYSDYVTDYPDFTHCEDECSSNEYMDGIRNRLITVMQNKTRTLPQRIIKVGEELVYSKHNISTEERILIDLIVNELDSKEKITTNVITSGLVAAKGLIERIISISIGVEKFGREAAEYFDGNSLSEKYLHAKGKFESLVPQNVNLIENLLVNHMFFTRFPCADYTESAFDEFLSLCLIYTVLRFIGLGCMVNNGNHTKLADAYAAVFRFIDHTDFHRNAPKIMHASGCDTPNMVYCLLSF